MKKILSFFILVLFLFAVYGCVEKEIPKEETGNNLNTNDNSLDIDDNSIDTIEEDMSSDELEGLNLDEVNEDLFK